MELLPIYPEHVELEIRNRMIVLTTIPRNFRLIEVARHHTKHIRTARELHEHILSEKKFWTADLVKNIAIVADYPKILEKALSSFHVLVQADHSRTKANLDVVLDLIVSCKIGSKTKLAKTFEACRGENAWFFKGFVDAVIGNKNPGGNVTADWQKGLVAGLKYKSDIHNIYDIFTWQPPSRFSFPRR